ncbi:MAG: ABC transporter permease subunit [Chloroflexota bacterium]
MSDQAGSIYNLGYQRYTGPRLGRRYAIRVLALHRLRACFGVGRPLSSKIFPIALAIIVMLPAVVQLGIGTFGNADAKVIRPENYYRYVGVVLALFCAAIAPELVSRDQRSGTLTLYFSRALKRADYALANFFALTVSLLVLTVGPQAILFAGNGLVVSNPASYLQDEWKQVPEILASSLLLSVMFAGIGLSVASFTPRRAYSTVSVLAVFILGSALGPILLSVSDQGIVRYALMISPFHVISGFSLWIFGASPEGNGVLAKADIPGGVYALEALVVGSVSLGVFVRRCLRIAT